MRYGTIRLRKFAGAISAAPGVAGVGRADEPVDRRQ